MKKAHKFILFSFIGPLVMTFFIAVFVLVMQFIWLYIDEMLGKGLEWYVLGELFFYATANVVPMAMPLAILLASIMTFGNLGEHFELVAFKSAGISLQQIMKPLILFVIIISIGAFYFANNVIPVANLKFYSLLYDIRSQKPAINIMPNVFYNEIDGYTIRVKSKKAMDDGREMLKDVMIYNHSDNNGNLQVTVADSGIMSLSKDKTYFSIKLFNGV
ncbi:MAG: permease, partial [Flavobacteriales bacterium CG_4_10_14_0_8_um_filter_32_5]